MARNLPRDRSSTDIKYNPDFQEEGRVCGYEHCIESMPFSDSGIDCPIFGHDCPGGEEVVHSCRAEGGRADALKRKEVPFDKLRLLCGYSAEEPQRNAPDQDPKEKSHKASEGLERLIRSNLPKLHLLCYLLESFGDPSRLKDRPYSKAIQGAHRLLKEFLREIEAEMDSKGPRS